MGTTLGHGLVERARQRVGDTYGAAVGRQRHELVTPALVLDIDAAERNIERMATELRGRPAVLRPHIKVHKSPDLAQRQVAAGSVGLSVATVWEAVVMAETGLDDLFVVNTVAGPDKLRALAELAGEAKVRVAVDQLENARTLSLAAVAAGTTLGVLIEVDTGMDRAGVDTAGEALTLARGLIELPGLRFDGLTGYEGHCSLTLERDLRHSKQQMAMAFLVEVADAIIASGIPVAVLSAGGTATWEWTSAEPRLTELQAGTYVVMDTFHGQMISGFEHALTVQTTVISRPPDRVIVDAGSKSVGDGEISRLVGHDLAALQFDEEHGVFASPHGTSLAVGDSIALIPGYAPSTVNWFDAFHVVRDDTVIDIWPVIPRGPGHDGVLIR